MDEIEQHGLLLKAEVPDVEAQPLVHKCEKTHVHAEHLIQG